MTLAKKAKGLPRFMLDCGFWREKSWLGRSLSAIGLHTAGVSYCHTYATDGHLPAEEELAQALGVREREVAKALPELLDRDIWVQTPSGLEIVDYLVSYPSAEDIQADRAGKELGALRANHERWHVKRKVIEPDCALCRPGSHDRSQVRSLDDRRSDRSADSKGMKERTMDGWMDETSPPPVVPRESSQPAAAGGGTTSAARSTATEAIRLRALLEVDTEHKLGRKVDSDENLAGHIRKRLYADVGDALIDLADRRPDIEAAELYQALMAEQSTHRDNEFTRRQVRALASDAALSWQSEEHLAAAIVERYGDGWATEALEVYRQVRRKADEGES